MALNFERGSSTRPRGHAILYFQDAANPGRFVATYVVVLPITMDVAKYIPPMFASQISGMSFKDFSTFAVPPVPEAVDGPDAMRRLAEARDDDVLNGGTLSVSDPARALETVNDLAQGYASLYSDYVAQAPAPAPVEEGAGQGVNEVLFQLMSERDRLGELSSLVRTMRFAAERDDHALLREAEEKARTLGKYLPERHRVDRLLAAAKDPSERGARLARLYLDRCYRLCNEDYAALAELDREIEEMEKGGR